MCVACAAICLSLLQSVEVTACMTRTTTRTINSDAWHSFRCVAGYAGCCRVLQGVAGCYSDSMNDEDD